MCKRFYVEVADLEDADNGQELLQRAGIACDRILVVDTKEDSVARAIKAVTGVGMDGIKSHVRERNAVAARTMYVHYCLMRGDSIGKVCATLDRPRNRINFYDKDFGQKEYGDREFRISSDRVMELLKQDPEWEPAKFVRPTSAKRRRKKRRRKLIPKPKPKQQASDRRQLEIQW